MRNSNFDKISIAIISALFILLFVYMGLNKLKEQRGVVKRLKGIQDLEFNVLFTALVYSIWFYK